MRYLATTIPGMESVAETEIGQKLESPQMEKSRGRVYFETDSDPSDILGLRSIEHLTMVLNEAQVGREENGLDEIYDEVKNTDFKQYFDQIDKHYGEVENPSFRLTASRSGDHDFTSMDVQKVGGQGIVDKYGLDVDLEDFEYEVIILLEDEDCKIGGKLSKTPLHERDYIKNTHPAQLNPIIAYGLSVETDYGEGDVVLDPFMGVGTIILESFLTEPNAKYIGGDIDEDYVKKSRENFENLDIEGDVEFNVSDARDLSLEDQSVDTIISNLPFGKRVGSHEENVEIYDKFFKEAERVLKDDGRITVVSLEKQLVSGMTDKHGLKIEERKTVNHGGLYPDVFFIRKDNQE